MTDTDTTTQAQTGTTTAGTVVKLDAQGNPESVINVIKSDAETAETKVETAVDAVKADVTGDASGVGKALSADAETDLSEVKTFVVDMTKAVDGKLQAELDKLKTTPGTVTTLDSDVTTDIEIAKAHAQAALTHIDASGFVSTELTKAKNLLAVVVAYIEKHI